MTDAQPAAEPKPFLCACGGATLSKPFVGIELWWSRRDCGQQAIRNGMRRPATTTRLRFQNKEGAPAPQQSCVQCRGTPYLILRDMVPALARFKNLPWKSAYLIYADGTPSERVPRAQLMGAGE